MKPTILLIMMGTCALFPACSPMPGGARLGDTVSEPDLQHFVLPRLQVKNQSLSAALGQVSTAWQETGQLCGEMLEPLKFVFNGEPEYLVSAELTNVRAYTAIHYLALRAGMTTKRIGDQIELSPFSQGNAIATRSFKVPPTFLSDTERISDAPRNTIKRGSGPSPSLARLLRGQHLLTSPQARASFDPSSSTFQVTSTGTDLQRVEAFVDNLLNATPRMIKLEARRATFDRDPGKREGIVSSGKAEVWLKNALRSRKAEVVALPDVTARPGQSGTVEIIREWGWPSKQTWLGTRLEFQSNLFGHGAKISLKFQHHLLDHQGKELAIPDELTWTYPRRVIGGPDEFKKLLRRYADTSTKLPIATRNAAGTFIIPEGKILILRTSGTSKKTEFLILEAVRIDAAGVRVRSLR